MRPTPRAGGRQVTHRLRGRLRQIQRNLASRLGLRWDHGAPTAPGSLYPARDGWVAIEHLSHTGRNDRIERPVAEAVPLFWRFVVEKFGVPHVGSPEFDREAHHQSAAVAASAHASDDQAFIDAVSLDDE